MLFYFIISNKKRSSEKKIVFPKPHSEGQFITSLGSYNFNCIFRSLAVTADKPVTMKHPKINKENVRRRGKL